MSAEGAGGPLSIQAQAELLDAILERCTRRDGTFGEPSLLQISARDAGELQKIATRLHRMAPHETRIRKIVVGE